MFFFVFALLTFCPPSLRFGRADSPDNTPVRALVPDPSRCPDLTRANTRNENEMVFVAPFDITASPLRRILFCAVLLHGQIGSGWTAILA